jgi:hypothetical protein
MSVGSKLQDMENIEENVVTRGAKPGEPMQKLATGGTSPAVEDLGGPTPENYSPTNDSAKLKTPGGTLKQVKDVVNKGAKPAEPLKTGVKEEEEVSDDSVIEEDQVTTDEVVAEEETTTDEVVEETTEEEVVVEDTIDVDEDINALIAGEELSEEFQEKARTIFEAAIKSKIADIKESVREQYETNLVEEVKVIKEELQGRVDSYLEYVADEWVAENQLQVEQGLKTEMTESFLEGMKKLFEDHYVTIPEEKYDVIESMVDKLDDMESKLNEQIEKNVALNRRLAESTADVIFADVTEGLAQTQRDKLATLIENVEFESEQGYREKLETLKESYFPSKSSAPTSKTENLTEESGESAYQTKQVSSSMERYLQTMTRVAKK